MRRKNHANHTKHTFSLDTDALKSSVLYMFLLFFLDSIVVVVVVVVAESVYIVSCFGGGGFLSYPESSSLFPHFIFLFNGKTSFSIHKQRKKKSSIGTVSLAKQVRWLNKNSNKIFRDCVCVCCVICSQYPLFFSCSCSVYVDCI